MQEFNNGCVGDATLIISNKEIKNVMEVMKCLEDSIYLPQGAYAAFKELK